MKKILKGLLICGLLMGIRGAGAVDTNPYTGGSGDGWGYSESAELALGGPLVTISSAADQAFTTAMVEKAAAIITVTDATGGITKLNSLRISIPQSFGMQWAGLNITAGTVSDVSAGTFSALAGAISAAGVTPAGLVAGITGDVTISFTSINAIPANGKIVVTFPSGFDVSAVGATATS
ncbi:MAG: hypothetical protein V1662_04950, partial [Candidatus Omnitrophota bacterium]